MIPQIVLKPINSLTFVAIIFAGFFVSCQDVSESNDNGDGATNPLLRSANEIIGFGDLTAANIEDASRISVEVAEEELAVLKSHTERNFDNTIRAYDKIYNSISKIILPLDLIIEVDPREEIRDAAKKAQAELKDFFYKLDVDEELYGAISTFAESEAADKLDAVGKRLLSKMLLGYERAGFGLDAEKRLEIKDLKSSIDRLATDYRGNVAAASSNSIFISAGDTGGLDSAYLAARVTEDGGYEIDVSYPSLVPFLKYSTSDSLRRELHMTYSRRAVPENIVILDSILFLRNKLAKILGYRSYAEYDFVDNMAKTPEIVWDFVNSLKESVKKKAEYDYQLLLDIKSDDIGHPATTIKMWETGYYSQKLKQQNYQLDEREVKQYFELNSVLNGLFEITQKVLGLKYSEVDSPNVWHPDVRMFNCYDSESDKLIGRFYLDLYPLENKYSHAAMFTITGGMALENVGYEMPEAALVCNFPKRQGDEPALMFHGDVETFFHEFGHLLHCMVSTSEFSYLGGPENVVLDFVEAPSQIYENWAWNKETLSLFAKHHETGEIIPDELLDKMLAAKYMNSGVGALRQLFYGTYALTVHDTYVPYGDQNTTQIGYDLRKEITGGEYVDGDQFEASFGHLIGYTAGYYGYMWSKVYAQDMWSVFEEKGPLNKEVGMQYRRKVLEPTGSGDALELVIDFLGREPNNEALLKDLGLEISVK